MTQAVSPGLSRRRPGFGPSSVQVRIVVDNVALRQDFLRALRFSPCQYHSTNALYSSPSTRCLYQKDKRAKPENLAKSNAIPEIAELWVKKYWNSQLPRVKRHYKKQS